MLSRERLPRSALLRLVTDEMGRVWLDPDGSRPGRGAWVQPRAELLLRLEADPRPLLKVLRRKRLHAPGLLLEAQDMAARQLWQALEACRRAGLVLSGLAAVRRAPAPALLICAGSPPPGLPPGPRCYSLPVDPAELGRHLGRGPRRVLGLRPSRLSDRLDLVLRRSTDLGYGIC